MVAAHKMSVYIEQDALPTSGKVRMKRSTAGAAVQSSLCAIMVFIACDSLVELLLDRLYGLSLLRAVGEASGATFGARFHLINLAFFTGQMALVMSCFALLREKAPAIRRPAVTVTLVFFALTALFTGQLVNLGVYPWKAAVALLVSTAAALPCAVAAGAWVYENGRGD